MIHESLVVGAFQCNCHILADEKTKEAVVVDPGDKACEILAALKSLGVTVKYLLHTHAHLDHVMGTRAVHEKTDGMILLHPADAPLYAMISKQAAMFGFTADDPHAVDEPLKDGQTIAFGKHTMTVLHTPGHTPGSCCFRLDAGRRLLFSGDTLFARSIGRTDLWGGDFDAEIASIRSKILALDDDTVVYPGHGPETRVGEERKKNPFLI